MGKHARKVQLNLYVSDDFAQRFKVYCHRQRRPIGDTLEYLLTGFLDAEFGAADGAASHSSPCGIAPPIDAAVAASEAPSQLRGTPTCGFSTSEHDGEFLVWIEWRVSAYGPHVTMPALFARCPSAADAEHVKRALEALSRGLQP